MLNEKESRNIRISQRDQPTNTARSWTELMRIIKKSPKNKTKDKNATIRVQTLRLRWRKHWKKPKTKIFLSILQVSTFFYILFDIHYNYYRLHAISNWKWKRFHKISFLHAVDEPDRSRNLRADYCEHPPHYYRRTWNQWIRIRLIQPRN